MAPATDLLLQCEFGEERLNLWIVGRDRSALTQIACSARQDGVLHRGLASTRLWYKVIDVEDTTIASEELQNAALRDCGTRGSQAAMLTDAAITLGNSVADCGRNVARIAHALNIATSLADSIVLWLAQHSALGLLDRMLPLEPIRLPAAADADQVCTLA